jgi:hypothetical protein
VLKLHTSLQNEPWKRDLLNFFFRVCLLRRNPYQAHIAFGQPNPGSLKTEPLSRWEFLIVLVKLTLRQPFYSRNFRAGSDVYIPTRRTL